MELKVNFEEISDERLKEMSAEEKLTEIKRAFKILKQTISPKQEDLIDGMYKKLEPPFNKGTIERLEFNHYAYICFSDIVQRLVYE
jgi:hypothetical protein